MVNRVTEDLAKKSFNGLADAIGSRQALAAVTAKFNKQHTDAATRRRRIILLDLNIEEEMQMWQILFNTPDKFQVVSEKESHQRGEYVVRVIFYELGEDLPVTKKKEELISENVSL